MAWWDIIKNDLFGAALVAAVLIALALVIKALYALAKKRGSKRQEAGEKEPGSEAAPLVQGELKLTGVDEKTAALIMAIVSHESGIPLGELNFYSIRNIGEAAGEVS